MLYRVSKFGVFVSIGLLPACLGKGGSELEGDADLSFGSGHESAVILSGDLAVAGLETTNLPFSVEEDGATFTFEGGTDFLGNPIRGDILARRGLQAGAGSAVPRADFQENLEHFIDMAHARNVKVLLMSEGIRPARNVMWRYAAAMNDVAKSSPDVHDIDTSAVLDGVGDQGIVDANHL